MGINEEFHSLTAVTLGERRKEFYALLQKYKNEEFSIDTLKPTTYLEEIFRVEALIFFKKRQDLLDVLKSNNPPLVKKIFKRAFPIIESSILALTGEQLVKEFFPQLSFSTKVKLLNKLALRGVISREKSDEFFQSIKNEYNLHLALKLLPCCSKEIIVNTFSCKHFYVNPAQLRVIIKNYPDIIERLYRVLINGKNKYYSKYGFNSVINTIVDTDLDLYLKLFEECNKKKEHTYKCFGKKRTARLLQLKTDKILKDSVRYQEFLHLKQAQIVLKNQFHCFLINLLPDNVDNFDIEIILDRIEHVKSKRIRLEIVEAVFKECYGIEIWNYSNVITVSLLRLLSTEDRVNFVKNHEKPKSITPEDWIACFDLNRSIDELKEKMRSTSNIQKRKLLAKSLVIACGLDEDQSKLLEVCTYFSQAHKNDDPSIKIEFLKTIDEYFELRTIDTELWPVLIEILNTFYLYQQTVTWEIVGYFQKYAHHLIDRGLSPKPAIFEFSKTGTNQRWIYYTYDTYTEKAFKSDSRFERKCAEAYLQVLPELTGVEKNNLRDFVQDFINCCMNYNKKHRKDRISFLSYPFVVEFFKKIRKEPDYNVMYNILEDSYSQLDHVSIECKELLELSFTIVHFDFDMKFFYWLLKKDPVFFKSQIKHVANQFISKCSADHFYRYLRNYSHLNIPEEYISVAKTLMKNEIPAVNAVSCLVNLLDFNEFIKIVSPLIPRAEKPENMTFEEQNTFRLQKSIGQCLKHVLPPFLVINYLKDYYNQDYFHLILPSLCSVAYNVNEDQLNDLLIPIENRSVTIRKHVLFLSLQLRKSDPINNLLIDREENEKNPSVRKYVLRTLFNYFTVNPNENTWELLNKNLVKIDKNDKECLDVINQVNKYPDEYLVELINITWNYIENFNMNKEDRIESKIKFFQGLNKETIQKIPGDFFEKNLLKHLFQIENSETFQKEIQILTCNYVLSLKGAEQKNVLRSIMAQLKNYWKIDKRKSIFNFVKEFCERCTEKIALQQFEREITSVMNPIEGFSEFFYLDISLLVFENNLASIGKELAKIVDCFIDTSVCNIAQETLTLVLDKFLEKGNGRSRNENLYELIDSMINQSNSTKNLLMICLLLKEEKPKSLKSKKLFKDCIKIFQSKNDDVVKMYFNHFLK